MNKYMNGRSDESYLQATFCGSYRLFTNTANSYSAAG